MADDGPLDPFVNADLVSAAKSMHDMFVAMITAGFTEPQALQVVVGVLAAGVKAAGEK